MSLIYEPFIRNSECYNPRVKFYMGNFTTLRTQLQESKEKNNKLNLSFNYILNRLHNDFLNYFPALAVISLPLTKEKQRFQNGLETAAKENNTVNIILTHSLESDHGKRSPFLQ